MSLESPSRQPLRVVVADDSVLLREGLVRLLDEIGVDVVGAYGDADALLADLDEVRPDIAVLDGERQRLERRLEFTGTDAFIEREARRLGLVRPGERLFIVKGVESAKKAQIP